MSDVYIDLNAQPKSKARAGLGALLILFSIISVFANESFDTLEIVNQVVFSLVGIIHVFSGLEKSSLNFIGKRFISINKEQIAFKKKFFDNPIVFRWVEIKKVKINFLDIEFADLNGEVVKLDLSNRGYNFSREIKDYIKLQCENFQISENQ